MKDRHNMRKYSYTVMAVVMLAAVVLSTPAFADNSMERNFMWDEAHLKMCSAKTPADFLSAAGSYQKLVDSGVRNGSLFYNIGTALLMAERYDDATRSLLRAERYMGSNWDIRHNLALALGGGKKRQDEELSLPWYRFLLFWHYGLSGPARTAIFASGFAILWIGLSLRVVGFRRSAKPLILLSLIIVALFGSSIATSLHEENKAAFAKPLRMRNVSAKPALNANNPQAGTGKKPAETRQ